MNLFTRLTLIAAVSILAGGRVSQAQTNYYWSVSSGTYTTPGDWNPYGVPDFPDNAWVVNGGTVTIPSAFCNQLALGGTASGTAQMLAGSVLLSYTDASTSIGEAVGYTGNGTFIQSGGINSAPVGLTLGDMTGSRGTYNLSGGSLIASNISVGNYGTGTFIQSGGTNNATVALTVGGRTGSGSTYNLSGGSLIAGFIAVGGLGNGAITQSGGTISAINGFTLGVSTSGSYNLSGGYLFTSSMEVDASGSTFTQTGGTLSATYSVAP